MQLDVLGKIREKKLAYSNTLLPLFEAVVNSIQAIEDGSATKPGVITIRIVRVQKDLEFSEVSLIGRAPIVDFIITDNGIGFTEANWESFNFAHSSYKLNRGGKGIGRILWLRAFQEVNVESVYPNDKSFHKRVFQFLPSREGVAGHSLTTIPARERSTKVHLRNLKPEYQKWCNSDPEDIALKIIEHCFIYFLQKDCPRISIIDGERTLVVNDLFSMYTRGNVRKVPLRVRDLKFELKLVKLYSHRPDNKIHYCADIREVQTDKLSFEIPELDTLYFDEEGEKYSLAVYVTGDYLNDRANEERTEISFAKNNELELPGQITNAELREMICSVVGFEFAELIESLSEGKMSKIRRFMTEHPRYRHLLKYKAAEVNRIPSTYNGEKLELELFKIQQKLELEVKLEAEGILKEIKRVGSQGEFREQAEKYAKIIDVGNSKLSEYIVYRKVVLDILESHLNRGEDGKYATEDMIHKLVFPLKKESDDIGYDEHNLWIIDERLAFHKYLASEKPFSQLKELDSDSSDRTDLIIFNRPFAFSDNQKPYTSIVIVEFKRPMRDDYTEEENPISQVNRYARRIIAGELKDKDGRTFDVRDKTPIYAYIVCDLTPKLKLFAKDAAYRVLPDNDGYFSFNENYSMYVEIISFDKLIRDSKHRNKALFEKLNLTTL